MKKINHFPIYIFLVLLTYSCNKDDIEGSSNHDNLKVQQFTIQDRPNKEFFISNKKRTSKSNSTETLTKSFSLLKNKEYLGRSYDLSSSEFGTTSGIRYPVINIESYLTDYPNSFIANNLNASSAQSYSFSSFERYELKTNSSSKVSAGFSLDLGLFSIGSKKKFQKAFSSLTINESQRVFGELNVNIMKSTYKLLTSTNSIDNIKRKYLEHSFIDELYNTSQIEFIDNFGGFVLTDYLTGGKATVLYSGKYTKNSNAETKETSMDNSIEASFSFSDYGAGADFGIGNLNGSSVATQNNIESFYASAKTFGGNFGVGTFTIPKNIDDINIDLGQWASSLNDLNNTVLIDINNNGLRPISDFIIEENLKHNINKILSDSSINDDDFKLREPIIEARWKFLAPGIVSLDIYLVTRFGDKLQIYYNGGGIDAWDEIHPNGEWNYEGLKNFIIDNFQEEMNAYNVTIISTDRIGGSSSYNPSGYHTSIADVDEANMSKFYNNENGVMYLLSNHNNSKIAYSIQDDYILDTYGMRSWVENLPTVQISYNDLKTYEVIGL